MADRSQRKVWLQVLMVALVALPVIALLLSPGPTSASQWFWAVFILILLFWMVSMIVSLIAKPPVVEKIPPRSLSPEHYPRVVSDVMDVRLGLEDGGTQVYRGRLRAPADEAYQRLKEAYAGRVVPLLQEDEQLGTAVVLVPRPVEEATMERPTRPWVHWLLFFLTAGTTMYAGARHQGADLWSEPGRLVEGLPYAIGLLGILGVHELGHYFTARRHGMRVTPPYFIPVPLGLGTFGAFIRMKSPPENRRMLFDVAVAGPLAGLVIAVPALLLGLEGSEVLPDVSPDDASTGPLPLGRGTSVGTSVLFALAAKVARPDVLREGCVLELSPLAFAGWLGLFITALNLLPIGQLDGGHTARAMFGGRIGDAISTAAMWSLLLLALFVWQGLLFFALIIFLIAGRGTPPLNDVTAIGGGRRWVGYLTFLILALILLPLPRFVWSAVGIHCPYL